MRSSDALFVACDCTEPEGSMSMVPSSGALPVQSAKRHHSYLISRDVPSRAECAEFRACFQWVTAARFLARKTETFLHRIGGRDCRYISAVNAGGPENIAGPNGEGSLEGSLDIV